MSLKGKTFITTVSRQKSERFRSVFAPLGATLIDFPLTDIRSTACTRGMEDILVKLEQYDWVVFTSGHGVTHFIHHWNNLYPSASLPSQLRFAVVGNATAMTLSEAGYSPDYTGKGNTAGDLGKELEESGLLHHKNVLLALGNLAKNTLEKHFSGFCAVTRINVYENARTDLMDPEIIRRIMTGDYDLVIFTSPSAVEHFAGVILPLRLFRSLKVACIGRVTATAALQYEIPSLITSEESTYEGLARQIAIFYKP